MNFSLFLNIKSQSYYNIAEPKLSIFWEDNRIEIQIYIWIYQKLLFALINSHNFRYYSNIE